MADAMILATARLFDAEVTTSDADFEHMPGVTYLPKPKGE
jgi:predicted nucleic acid-binding protein